jgi:hypothetical protein
VNNTKEIVTEAADNDHARDGPKQQNWHLRLLLIRCPHGLTQVSCQLFPPLFAAWSRWYDAFPRPEKALMPIYRLLQNMPMGPEEIGRLTTAYEQALRAIGVVDRGDPLAELLARKIIEVAQTGIREPADISAQAIKEIGIPT